MNNAENKKRDIASRVVFAILTIAYIISLILLVYVFEINVDFLKKVEFSLKDGFSVNKTVSIKEIMYIGFPFALYAFWAISRLIAGKKKNEPSDAKETREEK